jgi:hypothetical protein
MERRRLHRSRANRKRFQGRALKAEQCSPDEDRACTIIVLRETLDVRAAQPTLKNVGPLILIHALALKSRVNPELCGIVCGRPRMYTPLRSR